MTGAAQQRGGARLNLPRDLQAVYCIARMGAVTTQTIGNLFYGSPHTARHGMARLMKLHLVRTFPRAAPSFPCWYAATPTGVRWVVAETNCPVSELRVLSSLRRVNLSALAMRNRFWASLILAARQNETVALSLFRTEAELRRLWEPGIPLVPDAMVVLGNATSPERHATWFVELDGGTERLTTWREKARAYRALRDGRFLYGVVDWELVVLVPSLRRGRNIALVLHDGGAGAFSFIAVAEELSEGRALQPLLWRATELATMPHREPTDALCHALVNRDVGTGRPAVGRGLSTERSTTIG